MATSKTYSGNLCASGVLVSFSGIDLNIGENYTILFSPVSRLPEGTFEISPTGFTIKPSTNISTFSTVFSASNPYTAYNSSSNINNSDKKNDGSCSTSCDSIDPVSDPRYNMQQIIKQSILLEEHLTNKNKRCRDCITKHFLHIIGLAEEAQMLATNKIAKYPLINESVALYNNLFKIWIKNKNLNGKDESYILYCTDKLRDHRKQLIVIYFFNEKYNIVDKSSSKEHSM
jgi:hypothetical protein